jgi:DNA gyrase subunit A
MAVTLSQRGYIKRLPLKTYQAQHRGGKGIMGTKSDEEDPIEHLFVSSTHAWLLFFTNLGKVYWQKVYDLPQQGRTAKGRALVNLLSLAEGEKVQDCIDVREFDDQHFLLMATRNGTVKKTTLADYSRPKRGGIIAIKLEEGDSLIDVVKVAPGDDVVLSTANGMSIRFCESDARAMGRNTMGVKGITLSEGDEVVGMVVAEPEATLLTVCEHGYGKRTPFGAGVIEGDDSDTTAESDIEESTTQSISGEPEATAELDDSADVTESASARTNMRYRRQRRGGKGLRDIKTTERNGRVIGILALHDDDHVLMVSTSGKIQRILASDVSQIGRNTQGVRIMTLDEGDALASIARIPAETVG